MLRILKSCIPQTYYKEHVHDRTYKKKKSTDLSLNLSGMMKSYELCSYPSIPGKKVDSAIKTKITEHTDRNCLEAT